MCLEKYSSTSRPQLYEYKVGILVVTLPDTWGLCWSAGCLTSQQHANVSQGRICSDKCTCCHTESIEVVDLDQTFYLNQSQYTDTGPASPSADPLTPGAWQGSHWSANVEVTTSSVNGTVRGLVGPVSVHCE